VFYAYYIFIVKLILAATLYPCRELAVLYLMIIVFVITLAGIEEL
jgi:hypothetical protein